MKATQLVHSKIYEIFEERTIIKVRFRRFNSTFKMLEFIDKSATIHLYKEEVFEALKVRHAKTN
jgi:hypothetical protein